MSISKEKFKEMLREKGLKVTNQRILVLEVLADHRDKHLTAEDISIDYKNVIPILEEQRRDSIEYLENMLFEMTKG